MAAKTQARSNSSQPIPLLSARDASPSADPATEPIAQDPGFCAGKAAHLVIFKSGVGYFGIDIKIVQEIILMQEITPIPASAPYIAGMTDLRGRVIPVAAFSALLGIESADVTDRTRILVVENGAGYLGFVVDAVTEVMMVDGSRIEDASACGAREHDFIVAIAKLPEYLVSLVDVPRLLALADREWQTEAAA
jgi:purine-binding chemotaxis protein CheW